VHTRIVTFTKAKNIDGGVDFLRNNVVPLLKEQKGFRGVTASADRSAGVFGVLSLWETEADRDASDSALAKTRQEGLDIVGGELAVETFEQLVSEVSTPPGPGSALTVIRVSMDPAKIDENISFFKANVLPRIKALPGFQGLRNMINRKTGQGMVGTVWESPEARQAAEKQGESLRQEGTARGVTFGEMSFREIVFADMPS